VWRVLGIAAVCLAAGCTPASGPEAGAPPALALHAGWGPAPSILRIMPLGDSITYGVGSTDGAGYRARLERRLIAAGFRVDFVGSRDAGPPDMDGDNEGHSGWTISRMARKVDRWLAAYRPDVVLLHIGTNDVRLNGYRNGAAKRLGVLLNRIRRDRPAALILVARIVGSRQSGLQRWINAYNRNVWRMVAARDDPLLHLVDQAAVRAPWLHPNDAGYAAMADTWFTALSATVPSFRVRSAPTLRARKLPAARTLRAPTLDGAPTLRAAALRALTPGAAPTLPAAPTLRAPTLDAAPTLRAAAPLRDLGLVVGTKADMADIKATITPRSRRKR
jgi:lysophospholipase L1-like esterase